MTQKGHSHLEVEFINMKRELFNRQDTIYLRGLAIIAIVLHHVFQFTSSKYGVVYPFFLSILLSNLGNMVSSQKMAIDCNLYLRCEQKF